MASYSARRFASAVTLVVSVLAGCGGGQPSSQLGGPGSGGPGGVAGGEDAGNSGGPSSSGAAGSSSGGIAPALDASGTTSGSSGSSSSGSGTAGEGGSDAHSGADSSGPVTYPPLKFSDIGMAVLVSSQFYFTEGPVWDPSKSVLYFTDIQAHQGTQNVGAIYRLTPPSTIDMFLEPDGNTDGIGLDPQYNIIAAGFASRRVWKYAGGTMQTVAACASSSTTTCYSGQEVNTPDDITARSDGVIYFTDPQFGSGLGLPTQTFAQSSQGVYRLTKDGVLHQEDATTSGPNGVNLSPDEKTIYVAYTLANMVSKFAVAADGSLSNKQTFATGTSLADSMCVDAGGNVYVGTSGGLAIFSPAGQSVGTISTGGLIVTNCAFGGSDQKTLFITSRAQATLLGTPSMGNGSLYRVDNMPVPGMPGRN
jgi:gluconolactonase